MDAKITKSNVSASLTPAAQSLTRGYNDGERNKDEVVRAQCELQAVRYGRHGADENSYGENCRNLHRTFGMCQRYAEELRRFHTRLVNAQVLIV